MTGSSEYLDMGSVKGRSKILLEESTRCMFLKHILYDTNIAAGRDYTSAAENGIEMKKKMLH